MDHANAMRGFLALLLFLLPIDALAAGCGPDAAPAQAAAAGFNCETYRWGSGDDHTEIDESQTYNPGYKLYWGTANNNGHVTVLSDYAVQPDGSIITQTTTSSGTFVLNTCGGPPASNVWTVGQLFQFGYYAEYVGKWNATGHPGQQAGFYGLSNNWFPTSAGHPSWEIDLPDAFALEQHVTYWGAGSAQTLNNNPTVLPHLSPTVETGDKWGVLVTTTDVTWYWNDAVNGSPGKVDFSSLGGAFTAMDVYNSMQCFGIEAVVPFQNTMVSFKVWQAAPPPGPATSGGVWKMLHRR